MYHIIEKYLNKLKNPKSWLHRLFPTNRQLLIDLTLRKLSLSSFDSVLVIGGGYDPYRNLFSNVKKYLVLDIIPINGVTDLLADALALPFKDSTFDCIIATEVMEHISNPFLIVNEIYRVLKRDGIAIITIPFIFHIHQDPKDFWRLTPDALKLLFSDFSHLKIIAQGNRLHTIADLITTASPRLLFLPFRIINHLLSRLPRSIVEVSNTSSAPTGFLVVAIK